MNRSDVGRWTLSATNDTRFPAQSIVTGGCSTSASGPANLATLYRFRWEVETLFRELKTQYELDEVDTGNPAVVEILLYAGLLSLLVNRDLLSLVTEQIDDERAK
jgi:hypothetical protein